MSIQSIDAVSAGNAKCVVTLSDSYPLCGESKISLERKRARQFTIGPLGSFDWKRPNWFIAIVMKETNLFNHSIITWNNVA